MCNNTIKNNVVCICGVKNSGKTTLMEQLIKAFGGLGYRVAAIKHDGHDFESDVEGTDSYRYQKAGAYGTAVYSDYRCMMIKQMENARIDQMLSFYPEADLILVEGLKNSSLPKIELVRKAISTEPVSNPKGRFLIVTNVACVEKCGKIVSFNKIDKIVCEIQMQLQLKNPEVAE